MKTLKLIFTVLTALTAVSAVALPKDNKGTAYLNVDVFSIKPGEEKVVYINMENPDDEICGVSFELVLPEKISIKTSEQGQRYIQRVPDRIIKDVDDGVTLFSHNFQSSLSADGSTVAITYLSENNVLFTGISGALIKLTLVADETLQEGDYTIQLNKAALAHKNATTVHPADRSTDVYVLNSESMSGDIDGDGLDLDDISYILSYILNPSSVPSVSKGMMDVNCDGKIDVLDIVYMIESMRAR